MSVAAADSLWTRLDAAFAAAFATQMGEAGPYEDLRLAEVAVNETWNPHSGPWPRLILYSTTGRIGQSEHGGGGVMRLDVDYPYMAVAITPAATTYAEARAMAQALFSRLLYVLRSPGSILAAAMAAEPASTERAMQVLLDRSGASGIEVRNDGAWRGAAIAAWLVKTKV